MRALGRIAADLWWTLPTAMALPFLAAIDWWHPYCDGQTDGPGYFATGFPLPFVMPTGASSMTYYAVPWLLALDASIFLVPLLLLARWSRRLPGKALPGIAHLAKAVAAGIAAVMLLAIWMSGAYSATAGFDGGYQDSTQSMRPWLWAKAHGHHPCSG